MKFAIKWKYWADGKATIVVTRLADGEVVAIHGGALSYLLNLIANRGYNQ